MIGQTALRRGGSLAWTGGLWKMIMTVVDKVGCWFVVVAGSGASGLGEAACCGLSVRLSVAKRIVIIDVVIADLHKFLLVRKDIAISL